MLSASTLPWGNPQLSLFSPINSQSICVNTRSILSTWLLQHWRISIQSQRGTTLKLPPYKHWSCMGQGICGSYAFPPFRCCIPHLPPFPVGETFICFDRQKLIDIRKLEPLQIPPPTSSRLLSKPRASAAATCHTTTNSAMEISRPSCHCLSDTSLLASLLLSGNL